MLAKNRAGVPQQIRADEHGIAAGTEFDIDALALHEEPIFRSTIRYASFYPKSGDEDYRGGRRLRGLRGLRGLRKRFRWRAVLRGVIPIHV